MIPVHIDEIVILSNGGYAVRRSAGLTYSFYNFKTGDWDGWLDHNHSETLERAKFILKELSPIHVVGVYNP